jgi:hypothetical protein
LPVLVLRAEFAAPIWSETSDISNDGFYCTSPEPFSPGDQLACLIVLPQEPSDSLGSGQFYLEGRVEVIRLAVDKHKGFGIGCRFDEYHVIPGEAAPAWAREARLNQPVIPRDTPVIANGNAVIPV